MKLVKLTMPSLFGVVTLCLLLLSSSCQARSSRRSHPLRGQGSRLPPLPPLTNKYANYRKSGVNGSACIESPPARIGAPKKNVWAQLSYEEVVEVRQWLYDQKELSLSTPDGFFDESAGEAFLGKIELNAPNKTDVLPYLDGNGPEPPRYAKTSIYTYHSKNFQIVQEIFVGPIPVTAQTRWQPLGYPYSRKDGRIEEHIPDYHDHAAHVFSRSIRESAQDVFAGLWPHLNGSWWWEETDDLDTSDAVLTYWYSSWTSKFNNDYGLGWSWPLGLYYGIDIDPKDPENPEFLGWIYNETLYPTTEALRAAYKSGSITAAPATVAGQWCEGGHHGDILPMDTMAPPQAIAPAGSRFSLDSEAKYVQWMDFSFYMGFTINRGWAFYDIRHKGQRILYELSLQEALAHYAGTDPYQSTTWYRDAAIGMGDDIQELVPGYECPSYARHFNTHSDRGNTKGRLIKNSVCFFEFDADYPIARHSDGNYVASRKNIFFVVRSIYTVGNYDYMFSYEFYLDGSIKVSVRASGYIAGQSAVGNHEYGYDIHQGLSGGIHDHTLNFKADFDIFGTANTMQLTTFVPVNEKYLWSKRPRETFKLKREIVESEDNSRLNWNRATQYTVVNTDKPNKWGEYHGYRIMPADGTTHFTNQKSTNAGNLIHPFTFDLGITKFKDTEPQSTNPNDYYDQQNPMINFDDFFNGESLEQEDLVVWFNLGMHHLPHTGDLPFTLFTTAHASVHFQPLNYFYEEISTESLSQVEIDFVHARGNETVGRVKTFGQNQAFCSIDLSKDAPDLYQEQYGYY